MLEAKNGATEKGHCNFYRNQRTSSEKQFYHREYGDHRWERAQKGECHTVSIHVYTVDSIRKRCQSNLDRKTPNRAGLDQMVFLFMFGT